MWNLRSKVIQKKKKYTVVLKYIYLFLFSRARKRNNNRLPVWWQEGLPAESHDANKEEKEDKARFQFEKDVENRYKTRKENRGLLTIAKLLNSSRWVEVTDKNHKGWRAWRHDWKSQGDHIVKVYLWLKKSEKEIWGNKERKLCQMSCWKGKKKQVHEKHRNIFKSVPL